MSDSFARTHFSKQYSQIEKLRRNATSNPLTMQEINTLLSLRINNEPVFKSIDHFYTDEYKDALLQNKSALELEKIQRFRSATSEEANLLYNDLHARTEKFVYTGGGAQD
ncbi:MAG: hypothetical protein GX089_04245 [Fibrobacter sp.]|jgi:hypothetical protein|nr:hypothetical protein [Fibrobacter sp.]